jgi:tetratricopeptide (TPR) repeat protein
MTLYSDCGVANITKSSKKSLKKLQSPSILNLMIRILFLSALVLLLPACEEEQQSVDDTVRVQEDANLKFNSMDNILMSSLEPRETISGQYLSSQFAQNRKDWKGALKYLEHVLNNEDKNQNLLKMAMVLQAGSGQVDKAIETAKTVDADEEAGALAPLFLSIGAFKDQNYEEAMLQANGLPQSGLGVFIKPVIKAWIAATNDKIDIRPLNDNSLHLKSAVILAAFLDNKDAMRTALQRMAQTGTLTLNDQKFIADGYAYIGMPDQAEIIYQGILSAFPGDPHSEDALKAIEKKQPIPDGFQIPKTVQDGLSIALNDMALLLYQDSSDDSAKVFAHLANYLNPDFSTPYIVLAEMMKNNEQYEQAIAHLNKIDIHDSYYLNAQRQIAELYEQNGDRAMAIKTFKKLGNEKNDYQSLIAIGDIYRSDKNYTEAIDVYDNVEKKLIKEFDAVPDDYWYLYYMRGMAHEQADHWDKAEADLEKALGFRPENPYVLNYLGYAWTDQGAHLEKALPMIEKAVMLRPADGYITDSLGWVYYRLGRYQEAVEYLEKAIELMPYDPTVNDHLGDAYWRVGRKLEARFQWERAKNHVEDDPDLVSTLEDKLVNGLPPIQNEERASAE